MAALDMALDACMDILREELKEGIDTRGNPYSSQVVIFGKLAKVVDMVLKIQRAQSAGSELCETEAKLDRILKALEEKMNDV